jgi:CheY-like chemotaxis protein
MTIRVLVADDDPHILLCYRKAFASASTSEVGGRLAALSLELFDSDRRNAPQPRFEICECSQGEEAVLRMTDAQEQGQPFVLAILDMRMPPGINGMETGRRLRELDAEMPIIFVSGYSDVTREELTQRVPPPWKLHYYDKPLSFSQLVRDVTTIVRDSQGSSD